MVKLYYMTFLLAGPGPLDLICKRLSQLKLTSLEAKLGRPVCLTWHLESYRKRFRFDDRPFALHTCFIPGLHESQEDSLLLKRLTLQEQSISITQSIPTNSASTPTTNLKLK
jgi:hypothetical protein